MSEPNVKYPYTDEDVYRLRRRIHQLGAELDAEKLKNTRLEYQLSLVDGVQKIGEKLFWDISKISRRPCRLSIGDARTIGARALLDFIKPETIDNSPDCSGFWDKQKSQE